MVTFDGMDENAPIVIFPNPSNGYFKLSGLSSDVQTVRVVDAQGRVVIDQNRATSNEFVNKHRIAPGVYQVLIIGNESLALPLIVR